MYTPMFIGHVPRYELTNYSDNEHPPKIPTIHLTYIIPNDGKYLKQFQKPENTDTK